MRTFVSCFCLLLLVSVFYKLQPVKSVALAAEDGVENVESTAIASNKRLMIPSSAECSTGKTSATVINWRWESNAKVKVYFMSGGFTDAEIAAMTQAVNTWNEALSEINSDISFEIAGTTNQNITARNTLVVKRVEYLTNKALGEIQPYIKSTTLFRAVISVSSWVKNMKAFTSMMNHEMGHSLGLSDCVGCKRGSTVMAAFKGSNKDNSIFRPSRCDKYVVAASYFINNFETTSALLEQFK